MALRKIAGPYPHKDLYGSRRDASIYFWCDELDGLLATGSWLEAVGGVPSQQGFGILQLDGTFTPRRSLVYGSEGVPYYDLAQRKLAWYYGDTSLFARGGDWFILQPPYSPQTIPSTFTADGVHYVDSFIRMFLPDRMLLLGYKLENEFFTGTYTTKIFSLPYNDPTGVPQVEHVIQTEKVLGSGVFESWKPANSFSCRFIQSATPERSVFLVALVDGESKALEYDYIAKKVVGWVRRLGSQPELGTAGGTVPKLAAFSVRHKFWIVEDRADPDPVTTSDFRMSIFADEAQPAILSNPVASSPVLAGDAVEFKVRLTGADGEPCIGHTVSWASTGLGTVLVPQSKTDANGFAATRVAFPPRFDGPWEGTTITAEVIF